MGSFIIRVQSEIGNSEHMIFNIVFWKRVPIPVKKGIRISSKWSKLRILLFMFFLIKLTLLKIPYNPKKVNDFLFP